MIHYLIIKLILMIMAMFVTSFEFVKMVNVMFRNFLDFCL